jgi:hypothetical protein
MISLLYQWIAKLRPNYDYTFIPTSHTEQRNEPTRRLQASVFAGRTSAATLFKRWPRISVILLFVALVILVVSSYFIWVIQIDRGPLPPTFEEYREYERKLPQNNESLPPRRKGWDVFTHRELPNPCVTVSFRITSLILFEDVGWGFGILIVQITPYLTGSIYHCGYLSA